MPRGAKSKYTAKQERKADHIAEGYEKRGVKKKEAERRAWATVNKDDGGGKNPGGSGRGKKNGTLSGPQRRQARRAGICRTSCRRKIRFRPQGRGDPQEKPRLLKPPAAGSRRSLFTPSRCRGAYSEPRPWPDERGPRSSRPSR
jgi:plasmid stabilization system protein ParE